MQRAADNIYVDSLKAYKNRHLRTLRFVYSSRCEFNSPPDTRQSEGSKCARLSRKHYSGLCCPNCIPVVRRTLLRQQCWSTPPEGDPSTTMNLWGYPERERGTSETKIKLSASLVEKLDDCRLLYHRHQVLRQGASPCPAGSIQRTQANSGREADLLQGLPCEVYAAVADMA